MNSEHEIKQFCRIFPFFTAYVLHTLILFLFLLSLNVQNSEMRDGKVGSCGINDDS